MNWGAEEARRYWNTRTGKTRVRFGFLRWQKDRRKGENFENWEEMKKHEKTKKESDRNIKGWCYSWMAHCMITFYHNCYTNGNWTQPKEVNTTPQQQINNNHSLPHICLWPTLCFSLHKQKQNFIHLNLSTTAFLLPIPIPGLNMKLIIVISHRIERKR